MALFRFLFAFIVLAFVAASPYAQDAKKDGKLSKQEAQALTRLAQADMAEIAAGKLAQEKAASPEVKKYGEHMVEDHSKMLEEGKKLAQAKGVKPPAATDKKHQAALKKLQGLSGEKFDAAYMQQMVQDHEEALKLAQRAAKESKDPQLKAHAEKGAERIRQHLQMAKKLDSQLDAAAAGATAKKK